MNIKKRNFGFGAMSGLFSGVAWGLDTTISGLIIAMAPFVSSSKAILIAPIVAAFLHDIFSAMWMFFLSIYKKDMCRIIGLFKTRSGRFVVLAAIFGGPVGMMAYLFAIKNIGPGYTAAITAMYPAAGAFFSTLFLKERLSKYGWMGLLLSISAIIILGYNPGENQVTNFVPGFIAAIITVIGWSLESVICAYGMKDDIMPQEALAIRQITSSLIYLVIVVFIIRGGAMAFNIAGSKVGLYTALTALIGTLSYIFYYTAIDTIGPIKATGLNITYAIWAIVFSLLIIGGQVNSKLIICAVMIITGTIVVARDQEASNNFAKAATSATGVE